MNETKENIEYKPGWFVIEKPKAKEYDDTVGIWVRRFVYYSCALFFFFLIKYSISYAILHYLA